MNRFKNYAAEIYFLLGERKQQIPLMALMFLGASLLDLLGIGLIAPYVGLIVDAEKYQSNIVLETIRRFGVDTVSDGFLVYFGLLLICVFAFKASVSILMNKVILDYSLGLGATIRTNLMMTYQSMNYVDYLKRNSSEYLHNLNLADKFAGNTVQVMLKLFSDGLVAVLIITLLALSDIVALAVLVGLLGGMVIIYDLLFRPKVARYGKLSNEFSQAVLKSVNEGVEGVKEIRILGKEEYFLESLKAGAVGYADVNAKSAMITNAPRFLLELLMVAFVVLFVWISLSFGKNQEALLPVLSMFAVASVRLAPAANQIITGITKLRFSRHAVTLLYNDLRDREFGQLVEHTTASVGQNGFESLRLCEVSFRYPDTARDALCGINLELSRGEVIGFMGESGSGKTTLVDVILGLLDPYKGEISVNGNKLDGANIGQWRDRIAYLPQQVFLVDDTLGSNVALGINKTEIDQALVIESIKKAKLESFVNGLPNGLETVLGERGVRISGGQKQRVAISRAFYHQREVLVMDESTSALDDNTEKEIVREINSLKGKITMIVIAHRLTTLKQCDRIYRLENGKIVEKGTYEEMVVGA